MSKPFIQRLKISNFKSIDTLELRDIDSFSVFAGANGSGKSNFFDALTFFQKVLVSGAEAAILDFGGWENIRNACSKHSKDVPLFSLEINCSLPASFDDTESNHVPVHYSINIFHTDDGPSLEESLSESNELKLQRPRGRSGLTIKTNTGYKVDVPIRNDYSTLSMYSGIHFADMVRNIRVFRIDPVAALNPDKIGGAEAILEEHGRNLATVLARMEKDTVLKELILEWMELIVPSVEAVQLERQHLDQRADIVFKERYADRAFPAGMVSQGTMYALSLLVAILDKPSPRGLTLIEEPERGLHPKAIGELVGLMRETASSDHAIWTTTHSESVVKNTKLDELWLVDKEEGHTLMKHASDTAITQESLGTLGVDDAWLSNLLGAGLPW